MWFGTPTLARAPPAGAPSPHTGSAARRWVPCATTCAAGAARFLVRESERTPQAEANHEDGEWSLRLGKDEDSFNDRKEALARSGGSYWARRHAQVFRQSKFGAAGWRELGACGEPTDSRTGPSGTWRDRLRSVGSLPIQRDLHRSFQFTGSEIPPIGLHIQIALPMTCPDLCICGRSHSLFIRILINIPITRSKSFVLAILKSPLVSRLLN